MAHNLETLAEEKADQRSSNGGGISTEFLTVPTASPVVYRKNSGCLHLHSVQG